MRLSEQKMVAQDPAATADALVEVSRSKVAKTLMLLAERHIETDPHEMYVNLAQSSHPRVHQALLTSPFCPADVIEQFADEQRWEIRAPVALHPNTPQTLVRQFIRRDTSDRVNAIAGQNPNADPADVLWLMNKQGFSGKTCVTIAEKTALSEVLTAIVDRFKGQQNHALLAAAGRNVHTPTRELHAIVEHSPLNASVPLAEHNAVVTNPAAPGDLVLHIMLRTPHSSTRIAALDNLSFTGELLNQAVSELCHDSRFIMQALDRDDLTSDTLYTIVTETERDVAVAASQHENADELCHAFVDTVY